MTTCLLLLGAFALGDLCGSAAARRSFGQQILEGEIEWRGREYYCWSKDDADAEHGGDCGRE